MTNRSLKYLNDKEHIKYVKGLLRQNKYVYASSEKNSKKVKSIEEYKNFHLLSIIKSV